MKLSLDLINDKFVSKKIQAFVDRGGDMRPVFRRLVRDFRDAEVEQFDSEGHGLWAQLAPLTVAERGSAHPILVGSSGALRKSLTQAGAKGSRSRVRADQMFVGTSIFYAKFHQHGTEPPGATKGRRKSKTATTGLERKRMPARPLVALTATERRSWIKALGRYVAFGVGGE